MQLSAPQGAPHWKINNKKIQRIKNQNRNINCKLCVGDLHKPELTLAPKIESLEDETCLVSVYWNRSKSCFLAGS